LNRATAESSQDTAATEGLAPLMLWVKRLADHVTQDLLGQPDLEFAWGDLTPADPAEQAKIIDTYVRDGVYAVNEARGLLGLDPVPGGDQPMIYGAQGAVPLGAPATPAPKPFQRSSGCEHGPGCGCRDAGSPSLRKYNPDEPRVPAGGPNGGQWTTGGGSGALSSSNGVGDGSTRTSQLTIPWDLPADIPFDIPEIPSEITPAPLDFPGAQFHPAGPLPTNPHPDDPECEQEWADAFRFCDRMYREGKLGPRSGFGRDMQRCLLGQISERCGGNPVDRK
jgi:hypothetical protein